MQRPLILIALTALLMQAAGCGPVPQPFRLEFIRQGEAGPGKRGVRQRRARPAD